MKIISWNVNGLRAVIKKGFIDFVKEEMPDIICLQEIKANEEQVGKILKEYEHYYWNSAEKKGYSGTAVFSKTKPLKVILGGEFFDDKEGRVIVLEYNDFYLINVYTPNSQRGLTRLDYRKDWDKKFYNFLKNLEDKKPLVVCGDFNVAHTEIDLARPKDNVKNAGFTLEEREGFSKYVENGLTDSFRAFCKDGGRYSWWSHMFNARSKNIGWRIDYFLVSNVFMRNIKHCDILDTVFGSDHAPVLLELK